MIAGPSEDGVLLARHGVWRAFQENRYRQCNPFEDMTGICLRGFAKLGYG